MSPGSLTPTELRMVNLLGIALLVVAPIVYLAVAFALAESAPDRIVAGNELAFYILLAVAFVLPVYLWPWERLFVRSLRHAKPESRTRQRGWFSLTIVRLATVEICFLLGLIAVLLTGEISRIWIFYAVGVVWAAVWWPTCGRIEAIVNKVEAP